MDCGGAPTALATTLASAGPTQGKGAHRADSSDGGRSTTEALRPFPASRLPLPVLMTKDPIPTPAPALAGLASPDGVWRVSPVEAARPWFFVGDIHGDIKALEAALRKQDENEEAGLCLLGDLFDRGAREEECLELILHAADRRPGQIAWIAGNHDTAAAPPHIQKAARWKAWRRTWIPRLPVLALFPGGTVAVHGGFPTREESLHLDDVGGLGGTLCRNAFTWARFSASPRPTGPDGCWFAPEDAVALGNAIGLPEDIQLVLRGHDHPEEGFEWNHVCPALRILTLLGSHEIGSVWSGQARRTFLMVAEWQARMPLRLHRVPLGAVPQEEGGRGSIFSRTLGTPIPG